MTTALGTYALVLQAEAEQAIDVGALGTLAVRPGWYVYVGSAFGPGGLRARVHRHVRADGAQHWHVDYVRAVTSVDAVWYTSDDTCRECDWATMLRSQEEGRVPLAGFGASDCACASHLVAFSARPSWADFRTQIHDRWPEHAPIHRSDGQALRDV